MANSNKDLFSGKWGLIFVAAGSSIGLGNIWLFPYRAGELGGMPFIIAYIVCAVFLGFTAVVGEMSFGRLMGIGPVGAYKKALILRGLNGSAGDVFGGIAVIVTFVIGVGYTVIVSWVVRFLLESIVGGAFIAADSGQYFNYVISDKVIMWLIITLLIACISMIKGIEKGIERINKIMIPAIIALFFILTIRVAFLPSAIEGYKYLFTMNIGALFNPKTWILALGQAFYSLSVFGSIMVVYGSYTKKNADIINSAKHVIILTAISAILASLLIMPAVFAFGKDINAGPALMFITMPDIFKNLPFGHLSMIIFFIAVFFAALTSLISIFEVIAEVLQSKFKLARWKSVITTVSIVALCNIFINSNNINNFMDILQIHLIPFCALVCGILFFWIIPKDIIVKEIETGRSKPIGKWLIPAGRYVFCSLVVIIYILNILYVGK
jgi:NSS family neurotransmitter:Na+ symporter